MSKIIELFSAPFRAYKKNEKKYLIASFFILSIIYLLRTYFSTRSDFHAYYTAAGHLIQGISPYDPSEGTPFKYLPIASFFFAPFVLIPYKAALLTYTALILALTYLLYRDVYRSLGLAAVTMIAVSLFRFHNQDLSNHQVNSFLILLTLFFLKKRESSQLILAAAAFSVLASFKLTPLLLVWALFWMMKWRELTLIGFFLIVINFIPIFFFENKFLVYQDWWNLISLTTERPAPTAANVQSYASMIWYWFGNNLGETGFKNIILCLFFIILSSIAYVSRKAKSKESETRILCATLAFSIMLSPLAWKHTYLQLFPLFIVWYEERKIRRFWSFLLVTSVIPGVIAWFSKEAADRSYILVLGTTFFVFQSLFERDYRSTDFRSRSESDMRLPS